MAVISGWWPSVNGDRKYYIEQQAAVNAQIYSNGVLPVGSQLQVLAESGLTLKVTAGFAWINGYWIYNDADYMLTMGAPDGVLGRIDRVILKWHRENRETTIEIKKGAAASAPVGADLQRDADAYELCLAEIVVAAGITSITQSAIADARPDISLCGFSSVYDPVIATEWFAQFDASFNEWFADIQNILSGDVAGNLANEIQVLKQHTANIRCVIYDKPYTILSSGWTENEAELRKEYRLEHDLITANKIVRIVLPNTLAGKINLSIEPRTSDGYVLLYTTDTAPTTNIEVQLQIEEVRTLE